MKKSQVFDHEIVDEISACAYCGTQWDSEMDYKGCCGEVHSEEFYVTKSGNMLLKSETEIVEREPTLEELEDHRADLKYDSWKDEQWD